MRLRNACFISYRHGQYELMRQFVQEFYAALCAEIEPMLGANAIFLDQNRLRGGDFFPQTLAEHLFHSATMIMVYTPTYFHSEHTYCAREYAAMERLERHRLGLIGVSADSHGLILPVVLRGSNQMPDSIKLNRHLYDFESFQLGGRRLSRHPKFASIIRSIATYICDRYHELSALPDEVFSQAEPFRLPDETEVKPLLKVAAGFSMPFPRGAAQYARSAAV